jgi:hypothetical protein
MKYLRMQSFDGRQRELKSCLSESTILPSKKYEAESQEIQESNTRNNTSNNTDKKKVSKGDKKSTESYDSIISEYTEDESLRETLVEFVKMRQRIKKPLTNYALTLLTKKLDKMGRTAEEKVALLNQSIMNGWQDVYALKDQGRNGANGKSISNAGNGTPTRRVVGEIIL